MLRESPSKAGLLRGIGIALAALFLAAPNAAQADDECGLQVGTTPVECDQSSYGAGITYDAVGDLFIEFTNPTVSDIGGAGVTLTGDGSESIDFDSATTATELDSAGATAALLGVTTVDGDIVIATEDMDADFAPTTHGIFAQSTGTGSIDITTTGTVDALSGTNPADSIGIEAITNSGNITVTTGGIVSGNQYGIRAESGGTLTLDVSDDVSVSSGSGLAAIDATTTGTGDLIINILDTGSSDTINGQNGSAILTNAGGDTQINIAADRVLRNQGNSGEPVLDVTAVGETVVNNDGSITPNGAGNPVRAAGGDFTLNNNGLIRGWMDISDLDGVFTFNNGADGLWDADRLTVTDLNDSVINNAGRIEVSNAGSVIDGEPFAPNRIAAPGTAYTGTEGSVLDLSVFLAGRGQDACDENIQVGACLDLSGGSTDGATELLVSGGTTTLVTGPLTAVTSANPGIVLVDVSGGTSQAGDFVLHPDSCLLTAGTPGCQTGIYAPDPTYGAVLDVGGVLDYALLYNPNTQQHLLASVPSPQAVEYAFFIDEMLSIWHTTSETVAGRQAELRDGATGRVWFRAVGQESERDAAPTFTSQGNTFTYDRGYSLSTQELMVGADLISGENHVFGLHVGVVTAKLEFDHSETFDDVDGANFGAYGGWWHDSGLSLDGAVTATFLKLEHDIAGDFEKTEIDTLTVGGRLEAGWRLPLAEEALYVQPLATAAYARSDIDNVELQDNTLSFEDSNSMRTGLGVRLGGETALDNSRVGKLGYWLTARHWEEHESDGRVEFATQGGQPLAIEDDLSGSYEQVDLGVSVSNEDDTLSGFLSGGAQFADDKLGDSYNVSAGVRMNW